MPGELHNPPAQVVRQWRLQKPVPEADVVLAGAPADRVPRHGELGAAAHGDDVGHRRAREELLERALVDGLGGRLLLGLLPSSPVEGGVPRCFFGVQVRVDLVRTPDDPDAAQVDVPGPPDVVQAQPPQRRHGVVVRVVVVPGEARRVEEDHGVREGVVTIDNVRQVRHGFAALILGHRQGRLGVVDVDDVDALAPFSGEVALEPGSVVSMATGGYDFDFRRRVLQWLLFSPIFGW